MVIAKASSKMHHDYHYGEQPAQEAARSPARHLQEGHQVASQQQQPDKPRVAARRARQVAVGELEQPDAGAQLANKSHLYRASTTAINLAGLGHEQQLGAAGSSLSSIPHEVSLRPSQQQHQQQLYRAQPYSSSQAQLQSMVQRESEGRQSNKFATSLVIDGTLRRAANGRRHPVAAIVGLPTQQQRHTLTPELPSARQRAAEPRPTSGQPLPPPYSPLERPAELEPPPTPQLGRLGAGGPPTMQPQSTTTSQPQQANFLGAPAPFASVLGHQPTPAQSQYQPHFLHHSLAQQRAQTHQQSPQADQAHAPPGCNQQHPHHHFGTAPNPVKSKSCLTCADISIKWYIVVIALLGLICALIGTIVGAVHSAGRDYISLALLLIGVGLVLIAISWIALRITIKTYKSSTAMPAPATSGSLGVGTGPNRTMSMHGLSLARAPGQLTNASSPSATLHRTLINERLYLMAAAAAAAATIAHRQAQVAPNPTGRGSLGRQLLDRLRQRLPRRLARLLEGSGTSRDRPDGLDGPTGAENTQQPHATTLAALLHQYQAALLQAGVCQSLNPPPLPFLLPPPLAHPGHLFGLNPAEMQLRPPPPSYNVAMQDQRIRQQFSWAPPSARPPTPASPPRPAPPSPVRTSPVQPDAQVGPPRSTPSRAGDIEEGTSATPRQVLSKLTTNDIYVPSASSSSQFNDGPTGGPVSVPGGLRRSKSKVEVLGYL